MYFRYESISDIEEKIKDEGIFSGLTAMKNDTDMLEDHMWIVYEKKGSTVSIVPMINVGEIDEQKHLLGFAYYGYALHKEVTIHDLTKSELKDHISDYCLMLQYQDQEDEGAKDLYSVVFDDWDVIDEFGQNNLPTLCPKEFSIDAKQV